MDKNSIHQPQTSVATGSSSLLSAVTLFYEYDKTIPQVRAALGTRQTTAKR